MNSDGHGKKNLGSAVGETSRFVWFKWEKQVRFLSVYCKPCFQGGLTQPNTSGIVPENFGLPLSPWGNLFYYLSSPEQFKNNILIWFIMWGPGKTVNGMSWGEEDNVSQVLWLICLDLVQTGLCNLWAPIMDFTKASLSCQQYRGKRGLGGEPIQGAHRGVS